MSWSIGRREEQLDLVVAVDLERFVQVAPEVARRIGHMHPHAFQGPAPPDHRQQAIAVFVQHPEPQALALSADAGGGQPFGQRRLERRRRGSVFFGVGLARHFQDPAGFSQDRVDAAQGQLGLGLRLDPRLRVLRAPELARAQLRQKRRVVGPRQGRRRPALVGPVQQTRDTLGEELVEIPEDRRASHAHRDADLPGAQLMLRHQFQHHQALAGPRCRVLPPRRFQLCDFRLSQDR